MELRTLGPTGVSLPVIGQGTWMLEREPPERARDALLAGLALGMNHIDTAELYGAGRVEELLGRAMAGRRDELFLVSKVMPSNASRKGTRAACDRTLKRLGTDRLDLYLLHWPGNQPLVDTLQTFADLRREGKIRAYGVSNFDVPDLEQAIGIAGEGQIACNQVLYHLEERAIEHRVLPFCEAHGIAVVGYSPFGSGPFVDLDSAAGRVLSRIADRHGATPRQVALRFLVRRPALFTIPKAADVAHVRDNAGAGDLQLDEDDLRRIDAAFPLARDRGSLPML
jgi:diketogulonate reductase-like aldo/keto reductase